MRRFLFFFFFGSLFLVHSQESPKRLNDSAIALYKKDPKAAILLLEESERIAKLNKLTFEYARVKNGLALVYSDLGEFNKAIEFSNQALKLSSDSLLTASAFNTIGRSNRQLGFYEEALSCYLKALNIYEAVGDKKQAATVNNNIGMVYSYLDINNKAIDYHLRAKAVFEALGNKKGISEVYNNIAIIYANDGDLKKALAYFKYSLDIENALEDKKGIAESANNVGAVYYYMQEVDSALSYFKKSAYIERSIGNFAGISGSYNNIAQVLMDNNRPLESKVFIDSAHYYAQRYKVAVDIETALFNYSQFYEATNKNDKALAYFKEYSKVKDSLLNIDTNSKVAELEIEYQTEKKEKEILVQRANLAEKELDLSEKNNYILGLGSLAIVLALLGYLVYNQQKLKNRQLQKENQLKDALLKIETQNKLQDQRLRISRDLHDNIGAQLTFIISSLDNLKYGFNIPEKISHKLEHISQFTTSTIYELRDTIWAMNKNEISFEDLQIRISNYIDKANLAAQNIKFQFTVDEVLEKDEVLTSVKGMNIYRIIQEATNNALKYAEASTIKVDIIKTDEQLTVTIKDDGIGFNESNVVFGNGIQNMKKRAQEINGELKFTAEESIGTTITLKL